MQYCFANASRELQKRLEGYARSQNIIWSHIKKKTKSRDTVRNSSFKAPLGAARKKRLFYVLFSGSLLYFCKIVTGQLLLNPPPYQYKNMLRVFHERVKSSEEN